MKNPLFRCLFAIALLAVIVPAPLFAGSADIDEQFDVKPGQELRLELDHIRGKIEIEGWDKNRVEVSGRIRGGDWRDDDELEFDQSSGGIDIAPSFRVSDNDRVKAELTIRVPREFDVSVRARADTRIQNIRGQLDLSIANADVELEDVHGKSDISTANGKLRVKNCTLDGEVSNVNGGVTLDDSDISGEIASVNGNTTVSRSPGGIEVSSTNGNVELGAVKDHVRAETVNGRVEIDELEGWIEAETVNGAVRLRMVGSPSGKRSVNIETVNGDVELEIPENFSMDFDVEVESDGGRGHYEIISDFDLKIEVDDSRRRRFRSSGKGKISGGRNKVYIRATNGDVILKKVASTG